MTERERQILQGGNVTAVNADEQAIDAAMKEMAEAVELPSIAGNTGKYLKAGASKPEWADIPSGMFVTLTESDGTYTADKTFAEISTAFAAHTPVYVCESDVIYRVVCVDTSDESIYCDQHMVLIDTTNMILISFKYESSAWSEVIKTVTVADVEDDNT